VRVNRLVIGPSSETLHKTPRLFSARKSTFAGCGHGPRDERPTRFGTETMFDFARHRRIEHYGLIATQTGIVPPKA